MRGHVLLSSLYFSRLKLSKLIIICSTCMHGNKPVVSMLAEPEYSL